MTIDTSKLQVSTKGLIAAVTAAGTLFQIPVVHDFLIAQAHDHPHVLGVLGTLSAIFALLHNPEVAQALGIKQTVEVKTEAVTLEKQ